jgi:hypothetical protein
VLALKCWGKYSKGLVGSAESVGNEQVGRGSRPRKQSEGKRESSTEEPKTLAITDLRGPDPAHGPHLRLSYRILCPHWNHRVCRPRDSAWGSASHNLEFTSDFVPERLEASSREPAIEASSFWAHGAQTPCVICRDDELPLSRTSSHHEHNRRIRTPLRWELRNLTPQDVFGVEAASPVGQVRCYRPGPRAVIFPEAAVF